MESPAFYQTINADKTAKSDEFKQNFLDFLINFQQISANQFNECFCRNWQLLKPELQKKLFEKLDKSYSMEEISVNVLLYMYFFF